MANPNRPFLRSDGQAPAHGSLHEYLAKQRRFNRLRRNRPGIDELAQQPSTSIVQYWQPLASSSIITGYVPQFDRYYGQESPIGPRNSFPLLETPRPVYEVRAPINLRSCYHPRQLLHDFNLAEDNVDLRHGVISTVITSENEYFALDPRSPRDDRRLRTYPRLPEVESSARYPDVRQIAQFDAFGTYRDTQLNISADDSQIELPLHTSPQSAQTAEIVVTTVSATIRNDWWQLDVRAGHR